MIKFRMRKLLARIALPILTVWMMVMPSRAYAVLPLLVFGYASGQAVVTTSIGVAVGALLTAGVVGAAFEHFSITDTSTGKGLRVPMTASKPVPAPTGTNPSPSTVYHWRTGTSGCDLNSGTTTSNQLACDAFNAAWGSQCGRTYPYRSGPSTNGTTCTQQNFQNGQWTAENFLGTTYVWNAVECPSGFAISGTAPNQICTPTNMRIAFADSKTDYSRTGTTLAPMADADTPTMNFITNPDGSYTLLGQSEGKATRVTITPQATGGSTVQFQTQGSMGNSTTVDTTNIEVNSSGVVSSVSGTTNTGSLPTDGTAPTLGGAVAPSTSFPSDYAKTGEASAAAGTLGTKLDTLHGDLSGTTNQGDPVEPTSGDMPGWGNTFSNLLGWQLPAHGSSCPTPSLDLAFMGLGSHAMTMHCDLINNHFDALNAAMMVVWTVLALFVVLRA